MNKDSYLFIDGLQTHNINKVKAVPKSDLHNHFVLGGSRKYILNKTGCYVPPYDGILASMAEMDNWSSINIGDNFNSKEMRKLLIEATFVQAKEDGVAILEIGEDVWGLNEFFDNDIDELIDAFISANKKIAPEIHLRLQIGLSRHCSIQYLMKCLENFWGRTEFYSIDLYGDESAQPIENFIPIYRKAEENGLRLKAHVGEWGSPDDIIKAVELLHLNDVQHGIAAAESKTAIDFLIRNNIRLNITPTSNVKLGRVSKMSTHPIRKLYRSGVNVTINSDDILIFDSDVSKEYCRLFNNGTLTATELNNIRLNGLRHLRKPNKKSDN